MPNPINKTPSISDVICSKIQVNDHNNCLLGLIYYKSLCDKQSQYLTSEGLTEEDLSKSAIFEETIEYIKRTLGYYVAQDYSFASWIANGMDFNSGDVIDALHGFIRTLEPEDKTNHKVIIEALQNSISTLDTFTPKRTSILSKMIWSIENTQADNELESFEKLYIKS